MESQRIRPFVNVTVTILLLSMAVLAQKPAPAESAEDKPPETNVVEFGVRYRWGDVYGRPDLVLGPGGPGCVR